MKKNFVNVHVVVDKHSINYFDYLINNFLHCAQRPNDLSFNCYALDKFTFNKFIKDSRLNYCCNVFSTSEARRYLRKRTLRKNLKSFFGLEPFLSGSDGHSVGLNVITKELRKFEGHNVIADSDVAMITKNWDTKLIDIFRDYHILGTTYEDFGGFSSGQSIVQTYKNFPNANWLALRDDVDISEFDWMPRKKINLKIDNDFKSKIYNLPLGFEMVCDGGWWFPEYCAKRKFKALSMKHVKPSSEKALVINTESDYNEEYQLLETAFVAHQRGGSRHEFRIHDMSKNFYDCVEAVVGKPEAS